MSDDVDDVAKLLELRDRVEGLCFDLGIAVVNVSLTATQAHLTAGGPKHALDIEIRLQPKRNPP